MAYTFRLLINYSIVLTSSHCSKLYWPDYVYLNTTQASVHDISCMVVNYQPIYDR